MVLQRTWHILYTTKQFCSMFRNFKIVSQFASWWPPSFRLLLFNFYFQVSMCMHFFWIKVSYWLANRPNWYISREYRRGRDRMIVGYTTTYAISVYHHKRCEFESRLWRDVLDTTLCDKVCQWLATVGGFLRALQLPPPLKLTATI